MGLKDRIKSASNSLKETSQTIVAKQAGNYWDQYGDQISGCIVEYSNRILSIGGSVILDDHKYKEKVVDPLWLALPLPVRLVGRDRIHWDDLLNELRNKLFIIENDTIRLYPKPHEVIHQVASQLWTNRTNAPDLQRQQEAQRQVKLEDKVEPTSLNTTKRNKYDMHLSRRPLHARELPSNDLSDIEDSVEEVRRLLGEGRIADAVDYAQQATQSNPSNADGWSLLGHAYMAFDEHAEAISAYRKAISLRPNVPIYHYDLGIAYELNDEWHEALKCYERAKAIESDNLLYQAACGATYIKMERYVEGIEILEHCVNKEPDNQDYRYLLAAGYADSAYLGWTRVEAETDLLEPGVYATSLEQIQIAQESIDKAIALQVDDAQLSEYIHKIKKDINSMTKRRFMGNWKVAAFVGGYSLIGSGHDKGALIFLVLAVLYLFSTYIPQYVVNQQLVKGNKFQEFSLLGQIYSFAGKFNNWIVNIVAVGFGFIIMTLTLPFLTLYNLYRYQQDTIRRYLTSTNYKERLKSVMGSIQQVTRKAADVTNKINLHSNNDERQSSGTELGVVASLDSKTVGDNSNQPVLARPDKASALIRPETSTCLLAERPCVKEQVKDVEVSGSPIATSTQESDEKGHLCNKCGHTNKSEAHFCSKCGIGLSLPQNASGTDTKSEVGDQSIYEMDGATDASNLVKDDRLSRARETNAYQTKSENIVEQGSIIKKETYNCEDLQASDQVDNSEELATISSQNIAVTKADNQPEVVQEKQRSHMLLAISSLLILAGIGWSVYQYGTTRKSANVQNEMQKQADNPPTQIQVRSESIPLPNTAQHGTDTISEAISDSSKLTISEPVTNVQAKDNRVQQKPPKLQKSVKPNSIQTDQPTPAVVASAVHDSDVKQGGNTLTWLDELKRELDLCEKKGVFKLLVCRERAKWKYCNPQHWGTVPECPGTNNAQR